MSGRPRLKVQVLAPVHRTPGSLHGWLVPLQEPYWEVHLGEPAVAPLGGGLVVLVWVSR